MGWAGTKSEPSWKLDGALSSGDEPKPLLPPQILLPNCLQEAQGSGSAAQLASVSALCALAPSSRASGKGLEVKNTDAETDRHADL